MTAAVVNTKTIVAVMLMVTTAAAPVGAQNWASFRGDNSAGVAQSAQLPTTWDVESLHNVDWKVAIPGEGFSSPVIGGERIFLTTAVAAPAGKLAWQILAIDKRSGQITWQETAVEERPRLDLHAKASHANASVATDGQHVLAILGAGTLFAYDADGNRLWKRNLGLLKQGLANDHNSQWGYASSPIIYQGRVYVQVDRHANSFVAAYDVASGKRVWTASRKELPAWSTPAVYEGPQGPELIVNSPTYVRGYDAQTGKQLWRFHQGLEVMVPTPVVANGLIYVCGGYPRGQPIYAIRGGARGDISLKVGETSNDSVAFRTQRGGPYVPTPIVYRDRLYACTDAGLLSCYDARTGERIYRQRVGGAYSASPVAADGRLYLASEGGRVHVVKAGDTYELIATNEMGEACMASPAISGDTLFIRTRHHLYAVAVPQGAE